MHRTALLRAMLSLLLAQLGVAREAPVRGLCVGSGRYGGNCTGYDFSGTTDVVAHGSGFVAINRNAGTGACFGDTSVHERANNQTHLDLMATLPERNDLSTCPEVDFSVVGPDVEVLTSPSCSTVVFFNREEGSGTCFGLSDLGTGCGEVDFKGATQVLLAGGDEVSDYDVDKSNVMRNVSLQYYPCSGVAWNQDKGTASCWPASHNCSHIDFSRVTHIYSNSAGAWVAWDSVGKTAQCWGNPLAGGSCEGEVGRFQGVTNIYASADSFLAYNAVEKVGICWGAGETMIHTPSGERVIGGGDCSHVDFTNTTDIISTSIGQGWIAFDSVQGEAVCWGSSDYEHCNLNVSFSGVRKIFPKPATARRGLRNGAAFVAIRHDGTGFCYPDPCEHASFTGVTKIEFYADTWIGYNEIAGIKAGVECVNPADNIQLVNKTNTTTAELVCDALDWSVYETLLTSQYAFAVFSKFVPVRKCFMGSVNWRNGVVKAEGDFVDHVLSIYGGSYGVNGIYLQQADNSFRKEDGSWNIVWQGCQWVMRRATVIVNLVCEDDVMAANELFGNSFATGYVYASDMGIGSLSSSKYDANLCNAAAAKGFCGHTVFAAVCAGTCGKQVADDCTQDNDHALQAFAQFHGDSIRLCRQATPYCAESLVVRAVCKKTCAHENHTASHHHGQEYHHAEYNEHFRLLQGRRMMRHDMRHEEAEAHRRLLDDGPIFTAGAGEDMYVFMGTLNNNDDPLIPCASNVSYLEEGPRGIIGVDALTTNEICEIDSIGKATSYKLEYNCYARVGYQTVSFAICPWLNIDITHPLLAPHACDPPSVADSNALCVTRERCEDLCTLLGDDCIGIDVELSDDVERCYLNRAEGSLCNSNDMLRDGNSAGIQPPEAWERLQGYGIEPGLRIPDGHARRLEHPLLWASDGHHFARKRKDLTIVYVTTSNSFCRNENINVTGIASLEPQRCVSKCAGLQAGNASYELYGCGELDFADQEHGQSTAHEALCMEREKCEAACSNLEECLSFDMHKSKARCWLNMDCTTCIGCGATNGDGAELPDARKHDLVMKEQAEACTVDITTDKTDHHQIAARYTQTSSSIFTNSLKTNDRLVYVTNCGWNVERSGNYIFGSYDPSNCTGTAAAEYDFENMVLYASRCLSAPGMGATYYCEEYEKCPALGYCILSSERMSLELRDFRGDLSVQEPICSTAKKEHIAYSIERYGPRTIADEARVEFIYDNVAFNGKEDLPSGSSAHYLHQELFRDVIGGPRVRLQSLGPTVQRGLITLVRPQDDLTELGVQFNPPTGYSSWASDIIRIERFDADGSPVSGDLSFELWLPGKQWDSWEKELTVFLAAGGRHVPNGGFKDVVTLGATIVPSNLHSEQGWVLVKLPGDLSTPNLRCGVLEFAVAVDTDECTADLCDENADCVNMRGDFSCVCKPGWVSDGADQCVASRAYSVPSRVRVENDAELPWGWRLQEVELFADAKCETPVLAQSEQRFLWSMFHDRYCKLNQKDFGRTGELSSRTCARYCTGNTAKKPECAGSYGTNRADSDSNALCMFAEDCLAACAADLECTGVDLHEYLPRCYLNYNVEGDNSCKEQVKAGMLGDDHDYSFAYKDLEVQVTGSSHFNGHPYGLSSDSSLHTEWWSGEHNVGALEEYVEFEISGATRVGSVRVLQNPRHAASRYRVSVGPRFGSLDVEASRGYSHVQHAEAGAVVEDRSLFTRTVVQNVENAETPCIDLTCGDVGIAFFQPAPYFATFENIASACHCKQLCLDHVDEGCRSYTYYSETDTNFDTTPAHHIHSVCYLLTQSYDLREGKPNKMWTSGGVDLVLFGFTPVEATPLQEFVLTLRGAGFPTVSSKQRVKLVDEGQPCSAAPSAFVEGVSCTEPSICHPKPSAADASSASWTLKVTGGRAKTAYSVCYCAGVCFAETHWTRVPGSLKVANNAKRWSLDGALSTSRHEAFELKVNSLTAAVKVVPAAGTCADESVVNMSAGTAGAEWQTYNVRAPAEANVAFGDYIVCLDGEEALGWHQTTGADSKYLQLLPEFPKDAVRTSGLYVDQAWSAKVPSTAVLEVSGSLLGDHSAARIALTRSSTCTTAGVNANFDWDPDVWVKGLVAVAQNPSGCLPVDSSTCWNCDLPRKANQSDTLVTNCDDPDNLNKLECKPCCHTDPCASARSFPVTLAPPTVTAGAYSVCYCDGDYERHGCSDETCFDDYENGGLRSPTKAYLDRFEVTFSEIVYMTAKDMFSAVNFTPSVDKVFGDQDYTKEQVMWTSILGFSLSSDGFADVAGSLTGIEKLARRLQNASSATEAEEPLFPEGAAGTALFSKFNISDTDVLWLAAIANGGYLHRNDTKLWSMNASANFKLTEEGIFMRRTLVARRLADNEPEVAWILVATGGTIYWPEGFPTPEASMRFKGWDDLFTYGKSEAALWPGGVCGTPAQFDKQAGKLYVTARVELGATFVIEPGNAGSIEVMGANLRPWADRIMIVNCQDTCGVSPPSAQVGYPDGSEVGASGFFSPVRKLDDGDELCPYVNYTQDPYRVHDEFDVVKSRYCNGVGLSLSESKAATARKLQAHELTTEAAALLERHRCATKCSQECKGSHCFCNGDIGSGQEFTSGAVCLPQYECEHLCKLMGDACHSVNMHKTLPRCFINHEACDSEITLPNEYFGLDMDYSLLVKRESSKPRDAKFAMTELEDISWGASSRGDLVPAEGHSTPSVLRFAPLGLPPPGTYKVCFCDSDLLASGSRCERLSDYVVELGKMHVSGLGCLLSVPKLRSAKCFDQYYGGLRCTEE
jgi:hypothetical protein